MIPFGSLEAVGARVSHDGKRVVYQRGEWTVNRFTDNLYTARIDGTHVRRLAASDEWEGDPNWSPHDDWIVFESSADRGGRLRGRVERRDSNSRHVKARVLRRLDRESRGLGRSSRRGRDDEPGFGAPPKSRRETPPARDARARARRAEASAGRRARRRDDLARRRYQRER